MKLQGIMAVCRPQQLLPTKITTQLFVLLVLACFFSNAQETSPSSTIGSTSTAHGSTIGSTSTAGGSTIFSTSSIVTSETPAVQRHQVQGITTPTGVKIEFNKGNNNTYTTISVADNNVLSFILHPPNDTKCFYGRGEFSITLDYAVTSIDQPKSCEPLVIKWIKLNAVSLYQQDDEDNKAVINHGGNNDSVYVITSSVFGSAIQSVSTKESKPLLTYKCLPVFQQDKSGKWNFNFTYTLKEADDKCETSIEFIGASVYTPLTTTATTTTTTPTTSATTPVSTNRASGSTSSNPSKGTSTNATSGATCPPAEATPTTAGPNNWIIIATIFIASTGLLIIILIGMVLYFCCCKYKPPKTTMTKNVEHGSDPVYDPNVELDYITETESGDSEKAKSQDADKTLS